jgi:hypothetical protein
MSPPRSDAIDGIRRLVRMRDATSFILALTTGSFGTTSLIRDFPYIFIDCAPTRCCIPPYLNGLLSQVFTTPKKTRLLILYTLLAMCSHKKIPEKDVLLRFPPSQTARASRQHDGCTSRTWPLEMWYNFWLSCKSAILKHLPNGRFSESMLFRPTPQEEVGDSPDTNSGV